jgi:Putative Actinobacterial Holin-X, holin superfamily III
MESQTNPEAGLSTNELVLRAMNEARLLAKAELLHAKVELTQEVRAARFAGVFLGSAAALALVGLALLLTAVADALPLRLWEGALLVAGAVLVLAALCGAIGWRRLPRKPMRHTLERLSLDLEELQRQLELTRH